MEQNLLFWLIAIPMVIGALGTVLLPNILHAAMALVGSFFMTSILYLALSAEFVAIAQILVYIGGILIFIIFTILLTSHLGEESLKSGWLRKWWAFVIPLAVLAIMNRAILRTGEFLAEKSATNSGFASLKEVGIKLLSPTQGSYLITFEILSLLLFAALIGAIVLTRRPNHSSPNSTSEEVEE